MNPLSQRLSVLERLWQEFRRLPDTRLCRWLFAPNEHWFLALFLEKQTGPQAISNDIFITLDTPVQHWQAFFEQALTDLSEQIGHDLPLLADQTITIQWPSEAKGTKQDPVARFVTAVNQLDTRLRAYTDGFLVLCLLPQANAGNIVLDQMITALLMGGLSPTVRVLITDTTGVEQLATLPGRFRKEVHSSPINLQFQKVIHQVAALGSPTAPDVKFRQYHAELTTALSQQNLRDVLYFAQKCQLICQQERWTGLEGGIHLSIAQAYKEQHRYEEALARYLLAVNQMEPLFDTGDVLAGRISLMAWLGAGEVYETMRQRQRAIDGYGLASARAEFLNEWLLAVESHRRLAVAHDLSGRSRLADEHYLRLFALAEHLPPEQHPVARLPEIGKLYWQRQQTPEKRRKADELLTQLLGNRRWMMVIGD
ncbi:tetratricopeptide repeat protein [Spirosoma fluviale]|uniref:Tetratricopeptide repeat-containing protein n=1 Tax=Spirosoma fluviale TaxID=1597977 RepID=A0A286G3I9_9BACT|nr:hypothetical protein [Spirosoma fluviale]SOD90063.1 hypothetical protein SAMN06269250_3286 [Spirosoma fluviale]